jgi:hypothetical protein
MGGGAAFSQGLAYRIITNGAMQARLQGAAKVCKTLEEVVGLVKGFLRAIEV